MPDTFTIQYKGRTLIVEPVHKENNLYYRMRIGDDLRSLTMIDAEPGPTWAWAGEEPTDEAYEIGRLIEMHES
jgi:hypothetical protein